jgi:hypothetical protein
MNPTFGHFDDPTREYAVTDPLTPLPAVQDQPGFYLYVKGHAGWQVC